MDHFLGNQTSCFKATTMPEDGQLEMSSPIIPEGPEGNSRCKTREQEENQSIRKKACAGSGPGSFRLPMKKTFYLFLAAFIAASVLAQDIHLPAPQKSGGMPLLEALAKRQTTRAFDSKDLSDQQLSTLLWASFGISRPDGKRTAPSANDKQATDIYVLLKQGAYVYDAKSNHLAQVTKDDLRALGATQAFATNAPVILIFVANLSKMSEGSKEAKTNLANINVGYISQNAYLYCASEGLVTGARVSVDREALGKRLSLSPDQLIILAQSVGYPVH